MKNISFVLAMISLVLLSSCATFMKQDMETLPINTTPPGATVKIGEHQCHTPCELELPRKQKFEVIIQKSGYAPAKTSVSGSSLDGWLWGNLVFLVGAPIGIAWDFYSGAAWDLSPNEISYELKKQ